MEGLYRRLGGDLLAAPRRGESGVRYRDASAMVFTDRCRPVGRGCAGMQRVIGERAPRWSRIRWDRDDPGRLHVDSGGSAD